MISNSEASHLQTVQRRSSLRYLAIGLLAKACIDFLDGGAATNRCENHATYPCDSHSDGLLVSLVPYPIISGTDSNP